MQRSLHLAHPAEQGHPSDVLSQIEGLLNEMAEAEDWPITLTMRANLILEELVLNTLTYGDASGLTEIDLALDSKDHALTIRLTDDGSPFNPLTDSPKPDVTLPLAERPIGGLGVYLVRAMSEDLEYRRENNQNHLKLVVHPES